MFSPAKMTAGFRLALSSNKKSHKIIQVSFVAKMFVAYLNDKWYNLPITIELRRRLAALIWEGGRFMICQMPAHKAILARIKDNTTR